MDPNLSNGERENGDGWGEYEFASFSPLHFACCNGRYETAKVLLELGAKTSERAGWDGGYSIPLTSRGDYWYTG